MVFFFQQKTAYDLRISDWSSDGCSSYLAPSCGGGPHEPGRARSAGSLGRSSSPDTPQPPREEEAERSEREPCQRIDHMMVAKAHHRQPADRIAAGVRRRIGVDEIRRGLVQSQIGRAHV